MTKVMEVRLRTTETLCIFWTGAMMKISFIINLIISIEDRRSMFLQVIDYITRDATEHSE
jgi:hypothetical protein